MITDTKLGIVARQLVFAGALLVGCNSHDAAKQKLMRESKNPAQMPSWEATKQSEARMPDISADTYMAAGRLHETQGRLTRAAAQYRMAVQLKPDNVEAHSRLGIVLCQMRQFKEAEAELAKAIQLAPGQPHLHNNLGFSYLVQSRWADAEQQFRKAIEINPAFAKAHVNLGMVLAQQERYDEAMRHFQVVVPLEDAWFNIGLMYQSKSRPADAARAFKTALKLSPSLVAAQQCLDKLPPELVGQAQPFGNVAALAAAPEAPRPAEQPDQPVESLAGTDQPSITEQTTPALPPDEGISTAQSNEPSADEQGQPGSESPEMAEDPFTTGLVSGQTPSIDEGARPPITADAAAQTSDAGRGGRKDPHDQSQVLDPEFAAFIMSAQPTEGHASVPGSLTLNAATQPENQTTPLSIETKTMAMIPDETSSTAESSATQPSFSPIELGIGPNLQGSFALQKSPTDLSTGSLANPEQDEIVLGARPPMPPQARRVVSQATRPAADSPTPEELRLVIEALLDIDRTGSTPQTPKAYGVPATRPATRPATDSPQSQPSASATTKPSQVSMNTEAGPEENATGWHRPVYDDLDEVFVPGETFGPGDSEE